MTDRAEREKERERHSQPLWFRVKLWCVCEVNELLQPCYHTDDRQRERIKSRRIKDRKWV